MEVMHFKHLHSKAIYIPFQKGILYSCMTDALQKEKEKKKTTKKPIK